MEERETAIGEKDEHVAKLSEQAVQRDSQLKLNEELLNEANKKVCKCVFDNCNISS